MKPLIWIIDEEWLDYDIENATLNGQFPDCKIRYSGYNYSEDLKKFGAAADGILAQVYTKLGREEISQLTNCKVISVFGGGYDRVDVAAAKEMGIKVAFVPGYCKEDVSDYAVAAIFQCNKRITSYKKEIKQKLWGSPALPNPAKRIKGSKLLIIGLGRIGSCTAKKAAALGMQVSAYDPYITAEKMAEIGVSKLENLEEALAAADYISIHAKLTPETNRMLNAEKLACLKPSAYIINTARGCIIDEKALVTAVKNKKLAGAVLDVVNVEPPEFDEEIFNTEGIIVTPHISYLSVQAYEELKLRATMNLVNVIKGNEIEDIAE